MNANLDIDPEEKAVANSQASRFSQVCKVYAPMYRQFTWAAITGSLSGQLSAAELVQARDIAYADVLSAWQDYLAHYNNGRGVVLIGHSQGTMMLTRLISSEIDPNPSERKAARLGAALGGNVLVKTGPGRRRRLPERSGLPLDRPDRLRRRLLLVRPAAAR